MPTTVLQVLRGSGTFGGVASYLLSRYEYINQQDVHFDFLFCQKKSFGSHSNDDVVENSYIGELAALKEKNYPHNYFILYKRMRKFLDSNNYDVVHVNTGSLPVTFSCLLAAKKSGVGIRIAHSHSTNYKNGKLNTMIILRPIRCFLQKKICDLSTNRLACSDMAARNMFGNSSYEKIENGIKISNFKYDNLIRSRVRNEFNCSGLYVIGFVGRLEKSKNVLFLIELFKHLVEKNPNFVLWIIGDGNEKHAINKTIIENNLTNKIRMFGSRRDVAGLMQAMDCLVLPSKYEGLSITAVEAQASGLPVFLSSTLSKEHRLTDLVRFIELDDTSKWECAILEASKRNNINRQKYCEEVRKAGYDIKDSVAKLVHIYQGANK